MVLHDSDAYLVARFKNRWRERLGDDVERFACVAAHHDILGLGGANELRDAIACHVDRFRCFNGQAVKAAQCVRVHFLIEAALGVEHGFRALRGCGAVEEREVGMIGEQREVALVGVFGNVGRAYDVGSGGRSRRGVGGIGDGAGARGGVGDFSHKREPRIYSASSNWAGTPISAASFAIAWRV